MAEFSYLALQKLTDHVGCRDMDISALIQCAKARKEHFRPLGEVTVVLEKGPGAGIRDEMESLNPPRSHNSTCSMHFESAHHDSNRLSYG